MWVDMIDILMNNMDMVKKCSVGSAEDIPFGTDEIILNTVVDPSELGLKHRILQLHDLNINGEDFVWWNLKGTQELNNLIHKHLGDDSGHYMNVYKLHNTVVNSNPLAKFIVNFRSIANTDASILHYSMLRGKSKSNVIKYLKDNDLLLPDKIYDFEMLPYN